MKAAKGRFFVRGKSYSMFSTKTCCVTFFLRKLSLFLITQWEVFQKQRGAVFLGVDLPEVTASAPVKNNVSYSCFIIWKYLIYTEVGA